MTGAAAHALGFVLFAQAGALAPPLEEPIDDPKVARRLGTRVDLPAAPLVPVAVAVPFPSRGTGPAPVATVTRAAAPRPAAAPGGGVPHLKLGFRRFSFVRIGATEPGSTTGTAASEPFNSLSLDIYPISSYVRFGLTTQYGWQSGNFMTSGDYFIAQSFSLGGQLPRRKVTPFAEGFAGGGYMRRLQFDRTVPTVYWQLGLDAGAEVYVTPRAFVSFALGYLHPVNGFVSATSTSTSASDSFASVFVDTWSFKLGVGM